MTEPVLEIVEPGVLTTVQDRGRYGYQRIGVPVSGAADEYALRAANLLVGNDEGAACLEMTVSGPTVMFLANTWIAITGADLSPSIDGQPTLQWRSIQVQKDSVLSFLDMKDGIRSYLAVAGGVDVPLVMGSRSTYVQSGIGGLDGRALTAGDRLEALSLDAEATYAERRMPHGYGSPVYGDEHEIRVVLGPHRRAFSDESIATLLGSLYVVSSESDRMGYRLDGPRIEHLAGPDVLSDGNPLGAVQVPGDGVPRVLLADRGTTGGYTKIATVISADVGRVAQAWPGHPMTFKAVTVEEAIEVLREREQVLAAIVTGEQIAGGLDDRVSVTVDGQPFEVVDGDGEVLSEAAFDGGRAEGRTYEARATVDGGTFDFQVEVRRRR